MEKFDLNEKTETTASDSSMPIYHVRPSFTLPKGTLQEDVPKQYPHREICGLCHRVNSVGFHVPNEIWEAVVHHSRLHDIHCLSCFIERADEKLIDWSKDIEFYPVSLRMHINDVLTKD